MDKKIIKTNKAPESIGPYSQAVRSGQTLYVSGQIPINPKTKELVSGSIEEETRQVLENLTAILSEAGMHTRHVVKCTIYLTDLNDFKLVNEIYGEYFGVESPARETVEVKRLPMNVNVEISCIATQ